MAVEPLRRQETNTINSAAEGLAWVQAVGHPNFQLMVDFYHLASEKEDPAILVKAKKEIRHIHIANPTGRVFPLSAEEYDYSGFFDNLRKIKYQGGISVEGRAKDFDAEAPKALAFLRGRLQRWGQAAGRQAREPHQHRPPLRRRRPAPRPAAEVATGTPWSRGIGTRQRERTPPTRPAVRPSRRTGPPPGRAARVLATLALLALVGSYVAAQVDFLAPPPAGDPAPCATGFPSSARSGSRPGGGAWSARRWPSPFTGGARRK